MKATFGAGCFWGVEASFREIKGVLSTLVGYEGGNVPNPTYKRVCVGDTGHAEVVQVDYDTSKVSYEKLLELFWEIHDPTSYHKQGWDEGSQYRSVIFYHDEGQKMLALESLAKEQKKHKKKIVTEIVPAQAFYQAEEYHQRYLEKKGIASCHARKRDVS
jgi:peptide-methionine (S)-S-oxide reductase